MKCKYSSLIKNGMWELVPTPEGKNFVGSPYVLKVKHNEEGSMDRFEARLVAQGYSQVEGVDYKEVFSPVAHYTSVRSLLALANAHNLEIQSVHQIDVKKKSGKEANACISSTKLGVYVNGIISVSTTLKC